MDFRCESEITVRSDHALLFEVVTKPAPVIEYLKTIASVIGASHILGVFEDGDFIKIYFDDKKYVDTIIRSGIHVMGHHIKVDYAVPPGSKVTLSNVDPLVSNHDLIRLMSMFGSVLSPVFRSPISDDIELCHIDHGVRYLYMNINVSVPENFEFKYGDQICNIIIKLDGVPENPLVKKEPDESSTSESSSTSTPDNSTEPINVEDYTILNDDNLDITDPVVISVQSAIEEGRQELQNKSPQLNNATNKSTLQKVHHAKLKKASQTGKKIKPNVKYRSRKVKKFRYSRKKENGSNVASIKQLPQTPLNVQPSSSCTSSPDDSSMQLSDIGDSFVNENTKSILDKDQLQLFLEEVRRHREPIEIVKKYVGHDTDALRCLIKQLIDFRATADNPVKVRIRRLVNNLKMFLDA